MIGIVIVSHHPKIADGVRDLAKEMTQGKVTIAAAGGVDDTAIGTNVERIYQAILTANSDDGVLVLMDLGSAVMSTQAAVEMLPEEDRSRVRLSNAPLVEGAIVAAVEASIGNDLAQVNEAAENACTIDKLS
jgi:PTS hybrid protein